MSASIAWPALVFSRYFLSQISADAGCIGISCSVSILTASRRTVLMLLHLLVVAGSCPVLVVVDQLRFHGTLRKRPLRAPSLPPSNFEFSPAVTVDPVTPCHV